MRKPHRAERTHRFLLSSECICFMHTLILELHTAVWFLPQGFHAIGNLTEYSVLSCSMGQLLSCFVSFSTTTAVHCGCVSSWELMALSVDRGCVISLFFTGLHVCFPHHRYRRESRGYACPFHQRNIFFSFFMVSSTEVSTVCSCSFIYIDSGRKEKVSTIYLLSLAFP